MTCSKATRCEVPDFRCSLSCVWWTCSYDFGASARIRTHLAVRNHASTPCGEEPCKHAPERDSHGPNHLPSPSSAERSPRLLRRHGRLRLWCRRDLRLYFARRWPPFLLQPCLSLSVRLVSTGGLCAKPLALSPEPPTGPQPFKSTRAANSPATMPTSRPHSLAVCGLRGLRTRVCCLRIADFSMLQPKALIHNLQHGSRIETTDQSKDSADCRTRYQYLQPPPTSHSSCLTLFGSPILQFGHSVTP